MSMRATPSPRPTGTLSQQPTPTTSVNQVGATDTSPGGLSSRQSNDINESAEQLDPQLDAADFEVQTDDPEQVDASVPGNEYKFPSISFVQ